MSTNTKATVADFLPAAQAQTLWGDDVSGMITCEKHAGSYLTHAIKARPRARVHSTPLGVWRKMTAAEVASYLYAVRDVPALAVPCETCRYGA